MYGDWNRVGGEGQSPPLGFASLLNLLPRQRNIRAILDHEYQFPIDEVAIDNWVKLHVLGRDDSPVNPEVTYHPAESPTLTHGATLTESRNRHHSQSCTAGNADTDRPSR